MSVGKKSNDGNVSIFTDKNVQVYIEADVLITCRGKPILIGKRDEHDRYCIPFMQTWVQWQARKPSKKSKKFIPEAIRVYNLPTTEESLIWMHAVCGYTVKSTWIKEIKVGNFTECPMLNNSNVVKYYPETTKKLKGHLNQTRKYVRSTNPKTKTLEKTDTSTLQGEKVCNVYTKVYDVCNTVFTTRPGSYPPDPNEATSTSCSWWKLVAMPSGWSPSRKALTHI